MLERSTFRRCIYALGAIVMVFIAGEEISWGQRIFGFATPDFLLELNTQREFNVHNIDERGVMYKLYRYGLLTLFTITSAVFFCQRSTLFGIPLPSMLLMFSFLVVLAYMGTKWVVYVTSGLWLLFIIYVLLSRQVQWLVATVASLTLFLVLLYADSFPAPGKRIEVHEYLIGIACLFYALEIWLTQWRTVTISRVSYQTPDIGSVKVPLVPPWLAVCAFVMVCSVGLATLQFFNARATAADYQSIVSGKYGEPIVRSTFDIYLVDNHIIYFKESCSWADTNKRFFLHLIPVDDNDLLDYRKQYGFDNLDFNFARYHFARYFDRKCIIRIPLPGYTIDRIRTGQFSSKGQLWKAEFSVD